MKIFAASLILGLSTFGTALASGCCCCDDCKDCACTCDCCTCKKQDE